MLDWLSELRRHDAPAYAKCVVRIHRLAVEGHSFSGMVSTSSVSARGRINYRLLYCFHGRQVAILAHALTKDDVVSEIDIQRALRRRAAFVRNPKRHTYEEDLTDAEDT